MYVYESHLCYPYTSKHYFSCDELYCEECDAYDQYIGEANTAEEAWKLLESKINNSACGGWRYDDVQKFIRSCWPQ